MYKKAISLFVLAVFTVVYSGCATIFSGSEESVTFSSEPGGAKILVNGVNEGTTPASLSLKKGKEYVIEFVKDGYETKSFRLTHSLGAGWIVLDILCGLVGVIVDAATGNWYTFDMNAFKANLEPKNK